MEKMSNFIGWVGSVMGLTAMPFVDAVYKVLAIVGVLCSVFGSVFGIILSIKKANEDGKITDDEICDIKKQFDEIKNKLDGTYEDEEKKK